VTEDLLRAGALLASPSLRAGAPLALAALLLAGCSAPVAGALSEDDANRVVVALDHAGIEGDKEPDPSIEGRFRVLVAREEMSHAVATLRDEELPPRPTPGVLDAVGKSSLVPSLAVERAQYLAGLAGDLERTLLAIDGVVAARVHVSVPAPEPFGERPAQKATASVLLKHRGATPPVDPQAVQRLVAGAIAGLGAGDVTVVTVSHLAPPSEGRQLAHVGPIAVSRGSLGYVRALIAMLLGATMVLSIALVLVWMRGRRALAQALAGQQGAA
jgi:type III secretion protein J